MGLAHGTRLGRYEIVTPLDAGGMGEVSKAQDLRSNRVVAPKPPAQPIFENCAILMRACAISRFRAPEDAGIQS
jgi:hypothetical protein